MKNKFNVPENYFDRLEENIINMTVNKSQEEKPKEKSVSFESFKAFMSIAASIILLLGLYIIVKQTGDSKPNKSSNIAEEKASVPIITEEEKREIEKEVYKTLIMEEYDTTTEENIENYLMEL